MLCPNRNICDECEYRLDIRECPIINTEQSEDSIQVKTVIRFIVVLIVLIIIYNLI